MCQECGCSDNDEKKLSVNESITAVNDALAFQVASLLKKRDLLCVNVMGSPGSGKTTVIEQLALRLGPKNIAVIQGDLESDIDKERLEKKNIATHQINTHSGCHLNAAMINDALIDLDIANKSFLFIENVGNLVCPAGVAIGQHMNMVVSSTTEGSDKPKKYPSMFMDAQVIVISKMDVADAVDFDEKTYLLDVRNIATKAKIIKTSRKTDEGFDELVSVLTHRRDHLLGKEHHHSH